MSGIVLDIIMQPAFDTDWTSVIGKGWSSIKNKYMNN